MKICPLRAELLDADGRTDMTKLIVAFPNFANAPETVTGPILFEVSLRGWVKLKNAITTSDQLVKEANKYVTKTNNCTHAYENIL
jgi:hypothetical protein